MILKLNHGLKSSDNLDAECEKQMFLDIRIIWLTWFWDNVTFRIHGEPPLWADQILYMCMMFH